MSLMDWTPELDVGVAAMNHEHRVLLDLMNKLHDLAERGVTGPEAIAALEALQKATVDHFAHEEAYMDKMGYPGAARHKVIHASLLERFGAEAEKVRAANGEVGRSFFDFLTYWLSAHIKGIDKKYGAHVAGQNAA